MKNLYNKIGVKFGCMMKKGEEKLIEKLKNDKGEFYIDKGMMVVIIVAIGLIVWSQRDKIEALFTKAFDQIDTIWTTKP